MASQYMNLELPTPLVTITPEWASELIDAIELIDEHDHTSNKGKQVPTAGLNINDDLDFGGYSVEDMLSVKFDSQAVTLTGASNASSVYAVSGNLYFTNGSGTAVQITSGATLNSVAGALQTVERTELSGNLTISAVDTFVLVSTDTSAARTITLPSAAAVTEGRVYIIKDATGGAYANNITITPDGTDTIDTVAASITIDSPYGGLWLVSDGADNWQLV